MCYISSIACLFVCKSVPVLSENVYHAPSVLSNPVLIFIASAFTPPAIAVFGGATFMLVKALRTGIDVY